MENKTIGHKLLQIQNNRRAYEGNNVTFEESQKTYDTIATVYEKNLTDVLCTSHTRTAEEVAKLIPLNIRDTVKILDVGAGTGMVGAALRDEGFTHIDALDCNETMLRQAKELQRYRNYYNEHICSQPSSIKTGDYDVVTACAVFAESGHMSCDALREMTRFVKSGGYVVIINRLLRDDTLEPIESAMTSLVMEKKWMTCSRHVWAGYNLLTDDYGITWTFQVV